MTRPSALAIAALETASYLAIAVVVVLVELVRDDVRFGWHVSVGCEVAGWAVAR